MRAGVIGNLWYKDFYDTYIQHKRDDLYELRGESKK